MSCDAVRAWAALAYSPAVKPADATGQIDIDAPAAHVWAFVSDPGRMAAIAEETIRVVRRGSGAGRVGARFVGINRNGRHVWPTIAKVTDADPGQRFAFEVEAVPGVPVARWQYDIEPTATGCRVIESTWDRRASWFARVAGPITGVPDRVATNSRNIAATLDRLKAAVEAS